MFAKPKILLLSVGLLFALVGNGEKAISKNDRNFQKKVCLVKKPLVVFLITEDPDNYKAHVTVPVFAEMLEKKYGYNTRVLLGKGPHGACEFPDFNILSQAELLVVFARRIALPPVQMKAIKSYLKKGKPLIGIRTANHAFTVMGKIEKGYEDWPEFVEEVLGCKNRGYGPVGPGTEVSSLPGETDHPVLKNIPAPGWHSNGNLYLVKPLLDNKAKILLNGSVNNLAEPIAWTRRAGKSKIFYTSLGYPDDFQTIQFTTLMLNAVKWALEGEI